MADTISKAKRSLVMAAVRSKGNRETELKLVGILRAAGITGWRRHLPVPGKPDFVFPKERIAMFIDGCFWHACPKHLRRPQMNKKYWREKFKRNRLRDRFVTNLLRQNGWVVVRIWEHELKNEKSLLTRLLKLKV